MLHFLQAKEILPREALLPSMTLRNIYINLIYRTETPKYNLCRRNHAMSEKVASLLAGVAIAKQTRQSESMELQAHC